MSDVKSGSKRRPAREGSLEPAATDRPDLGCRSTAEAARPGVPCFVRLTGFTGAHGHSDREGHAGGEMPTITGKPTISRLVSNYGHVGRVHRSGCRYAWAAVGLGSIEGAEEVGQL